LKILSNGTQPNQPSNSSSARCNIQSPSSSIKPSTIQQQASKELGSLFNKCVNKPKGTINKRHAVLKEADIDLKYYAEMVDMKNYTEIEDREYWTEEQIEKWKLDKDIDAMILKVFPKPTSELWVERYERIRKGKQLMWILLNKEYDKIEKKSDVENDFVKQKQEWNEIWNAKEFERKQEEEALRKREYVLEKEERLFNYKLENYERNKELSDWINKKKVENELGEIAKKNDKYIRKTILEKQNILEKKCMSEIEGRQIVWKGILNKCYLQIERKQNVWDNERIQKNTERKFFIILFVAMFGVIIGQLIICICLCCNNCKHFHNANTESETQNLNDVVLLNVNNKTVLA
jgi:hypothetical protein